MTPLVAFNADHQQLVIAQPVVLARTGANGVQSKSTH